MASLLLATSRSLRGKSRESCSRYSASPSYGSARMLGVVAQRQVASSAAVGVNLVAAIGKSLGAVGLIDDGSARVRAGRGRSMQGPVGRAVATNIARSRGKVRQSHGADTRARGLHMTRLGLRRGAIAWVVAAGMALIAAATASAQQGVLTATSCPSVTLCVALPSNTPSVLVANPQLDSPWVENIVDRENALADVACPSESFCAAVDSIGDVATSTQPANTLRPWTLTHIDGHLTDAQAAGFYKGSPPTLPQLNSISCPSASFCAAVDNVGNILTSTEPGSGGPWQVTHADAANNLDAVACPTASLCVATDAAGNLLTTTDPTGGPSAWTVTPIDPNGGGFYGLSCPSASECFAADGQWNAFASADPANPASWAITGNLGAPAPTITTTAGGTVLGTKLPFSNILSCPTVALCTIPAFYDGSTGTMFTSTDPAATPSQWTGVAFADATDDVVSVSCPSVSLCVGGGFYTNGVTSSSPANATPNWATTIPASPTISSSSAGPTAQVSRASLSDIISKPKLTFTVTAQTGALPFQAIQFDPEPNNARGTPIQNGMSVSSSPQELAKDISVSSGSARVPFTAHNDAGTLLLYLKAPTSPVTVTITAPALSAVYQSVLAAASGPAGHRTIPSFATAFDEVGLGNNDERNMRVALAQLPGTTRPARLVIGRVHTHAGTVSLVVTVRVGAGRVSATARSGRRRRKVTVRRQRMTYTLHTQLPAGSWTITVHFAGARGWQTQTLSVRVRIQ